MGIANFQGFSHKLTTFYRFFPQSNLIAVRFIDFLGTFPTIHGFSCILFRVISFIKKLILFLLLYYFFGYRLITPSGVSSVGAGLETPQSMIELRKKTIEEAMEDSTGLVTPSTQLYRILPETETNLQPNALMGSTKLYDVAGVTGAQRGIEVSILFHVCNRFKVYLDSGFLSLTYLSALKR